MSGGIYLASATQPLRYGTNVSSGIYLASATPPLRYSASLPFGVYLVPAAPPLRHTLITALYGKGPRNTTAKAAEMLTLRVVHSIRME